MLENLEIRNAVHEAGMRQIDIIVNYCNHPSHMTAEEAWAIIQPDLCVADMEFAEALAQAGYDPRLGLTMQRDGGLCRH
ncbi:MAG: hypothetical protein ABJX32_06230 [Tateyamaria sp.]|uniref:hypothetical protein n=1 Tax=Tateyamaria sp. TaxID=1929288 RepID=UPI00329E55AD